MYRRRTPWPLLFGLAACASPTPDDTTAFADSAVGADAAAARDGAFAHDTSSRDAETRRSSARAPFGTPLSVDALRPGDLYFSEVMADPDTTADTWGEWFEVSSARDEAVDLAGLTIHDDRHESFTVDVSFVLPPGGRAVFAESADPTRNGGITPDVVIQGVSLSNSGDVLSLDAPGGTVDRVGLFELAGFFFPSGASLELRRRDPSASANDRSRAWCTATTAWPGSAGDLGTPGAPNDC